MRHLLSIARTLTAVSVLTAVAGAVGCATEQKVIRTSHYTLSHPDFWQVKAVAQKPAEPTILKIGQYGSSIINEGTGATEGAAYESSQAEVEVRVIAWPEPAGGPENASPTERVSQLLFKDPELKIGEHGLINQQQAECGKEFQRKYTVMGAEQTPMDLLVRPGWRTILVGGKTPSALIGVISRVPYEQDGGLYCHNLSNMRTQLETVLVNLTAVSPQAPAATPATAPAATTAPAEPAPAPATPAPSP